MEAINSLKLEAIFYPKFDNDKQQKSSQGASSAQQSVRTTMVQALDAANENEHNTSDSDSKVYLEASLKHSGSLLLWSGGDSRFYAKNSMDNVFSLTGEMLLRQHFARVQLAGNMNTNTRSDETNSNSNKRKLNGTYDSEEMYRACSAEVQRRRLCLSFECVTAVLGDHGDVPKRDYLILTAVADMNQECFFSTHDLVKFAQQWRLPHNDVWLFANRESAEALFRFYDNSRETAFAKAVVQALDEIASVSIKSMLPHVDFQGDILEGLVVRLVKQNRHKDGNGGDDDIHILSRMQQLALDSREILNDVPPQVPPFPQSSQCHDSCNVGALCTDIREFSARFGRRRTATGSDPGEKENELRRLIGNQRKVVRASRSEIGKKAAANGPSSEVNDLDFVRLVKDLLRRHASASLGDGHAFDSETIRIAGLVQSLERQHLPINFKCHEVSCGVDENGHKKSDFICIIHVKADSVFPQYYRNKAAADMDLFRGFSIRINANRNGNGRFTPPAPNMSREQAIDVTKSGEALMLKLKFLPYMVRTFGCRNGLSTLAKHGPEAFNDYVANLLRKWGISVAGSEKWMSFFRAWGEYAYPKVVVKDKLHEDAQITSSSYLNHLQNFSDMYHSNALKSSNEKSYEDKFRGIVAIVGVDASCHYVAESIASSLGSFFVRNVKKLTPEKVIMARGVNGRGLVCACNVKDGPGKIRKLLPKHQEALCIVLLGCGNKEFTHSTTAMNAKERKKMLGMLNSWKMTRVKRTFDITLTAIGSKEKHQNSSAYKDLLNELRSFSQAIPKPDNRSGMLVFFPGIPGSGKTCLTKIIDSYQASKDGAGMKLSEIHISDDRTSNEADAKIEEKIEALISSKRSIIVRCSDAVKTKYWPLVREEKYEEPSAIYIADKNATSIVWDTIGSICTGSRSIAVPILPAVPALKVTEIIGGSDCVKLGKASDMDFDLPQSTSPTHIYPFSLHYLAVCMSRVLLRSPGTHVGRLDSGTAEACMVVVKFFCLYRHLSPDTFLEKMLRRVTNESIATEVQPVINVPFFKDKNLPDLPTDLEEALVDALRVQVSQFRLLPFI